MTELTSLTLADAREGLRKRAFSAFELTEAHLAAMEQARALNAYVLETPNEARAMARAADGRLQSGDAQPLEGIPIGVKDMFATKNVRTTACSHVLDNFVPTYESTVSANLWRDGAVLLGKLNNDEFAMGSSNETSFFGPVISPWRRAGANTPLVPGGSSGGSSAAVAANLCLGATGTDTGGSIRQPAALTGVVGIKPTYGRCSRWGIVAYASSLDQAGPFARSVRHGLRASARDITAMYENTRAEGFGPEVRRRIMIGTYVLSAGYYDAYYLRAQKVRTLIKRDFEEVFAEGIDALITPTTPSPAFALGEKASGDPVEMYLNDVFTVTVNLAGLPGISVPAGLSAERLPLGLQLIGRPFDEETLFALAYVIEQAAGRFSPQRWW